MSEASQQTTKHTREWLLRLQREETLDPQSRGALEAALDLVVDQSPCALVLHIARALDAPEGDALSAASFGELFFASTSLVDDVQDGDASLDDLTTALQMYALAIEVCAPEIRGPVALCTAQMAMGQRLEMARKDWDIDAYARVAHLTSGAEFRALMLAAAHAAGQDFRPWEAVGDALGQLIHLRVDEVSVDDRLTVLPSDDVKEYGRRLRREFLRSLRDVPQAAWPPLRRAGGYAC